MGRPSIFSTSSREHTDKSNLRTRHSSSIERLTASETTQASSPQPPLLLRVIRNLFFLLTLIYVLGVIAFGVLWTFIGESRWWVAVLVNFAPYYFFPVFILIPLALILRAKRATLLLLPILVSSVILYGGYFVPRLTPPADPAWSLKIIALNVSDRLQPIERIEEWLRANPADIVVLSEVYIPLENTLLRMLDMYPYGAGHNRWNAVAVLSRYPLTAGSGWLAGETGYPHYPQVTVQVGDQPITLIATSLVAPTGARGRILLPDVHSRMVNSAWDMVLGYDDSFRDAEVTQIMEWVEASEHPVIVAGDMNLVEASDDYRRLSSLLSDSFREASTGFGFTYPAWEAFGLPPGLPALMRIDYVWHTPDLVTLNAQNGEYVGSDHLPIIATIGGY